MNFKKMTSIVPARMLALSLPVATEGDIVPLTDKTTVLVEVTV